MSQYVKLMTLYLTEVFYGQSFSRPFIYFLDNVMSLPSTSIILVEKI